MSQFFNFPGDPTIANGLICAVYIGFITGGYAIGIAWLKHYLNRSAGARLLGKLIGALAGVSVAGFQTRILARHFANLNDETISLVLIAFIVANAFICIRLFENSETKNWRAP